MYWEETQIAITASITVRRDTETPSSPTANGIMGMDDDQHLSQMEQGHIDDDKVDTLAVYRQSKTTPFVRQVKYFQTLLGFTFSLVLCGLVLLVPISLLPWTNYRAFEKDSFGRKAVDRRLWGEHREARLHHDIGRNAFVLCTGGIEK